METVKAQASMPYIQSCCLVSLARLDESRHKATELRTLQGKMRHAYQNVNRWHRQDSALIRPCRRGPGRSPCLEVYLYTGWRRCRRPFFPVHHWTSVSPRAPPGPHPKTTPKFTCAPTANPQGTEGFLKDFGVSRTPKICIMSTAVLKTSPKAPLGVLLRND